MANSKNCPTNKVKVHGKFVLESDCRSCKEQCSKGLEYIRVYKLKGQGNGVWCAK